MVLHSCWLKSSSNPADFSVSFFSFWDVSVVLNLRGEKKRSAKRCFNFPLDRSGAAHHPNSETQGSPDGMLGSQHGPFSHTLPSLQGYPLVSWNYRGSTLLYRGFCSCCLIPFSLLNGYTPSFFVSGRFLETWNWFYLFGIFLCSLPHPFLLPMSLYSLASMGEKCK